MTVSKLRDEVDTIEFEQWKFFYKMYDKGGARSPTDEKMDLLISRLTALLHNINSKSSIDLNDALIFPLPDSSIGIDRRRAKMDGQLKAIAEIFGEKKKTVQKQKPKTKSTKRVRGKPHVK